MTNEAPRPVELGTARDELPYFAGRTEELSRLDKRLDRLCRTGDPTGGMSLIVGVPGVSRPGEIIHLQPLSACEAADAISGNMRALGHEIPSPCVKALAAASHGFPQHIHGYLVGALDAVARHGRLEEGPALQAALAGGNQARIDYYQGRLSLLRGIQPMLALVEVMDKQNVDALAIENATQALDDANFNGAVAIERAIAHGVLSEDPLGNVSFGIPSFHTYMIELREDGR